MKLKIAVVSDLHFFAQAEHIDTDPSKVEDGTTRKQIEKIRAAAAENDVLILNGDVFEYMYPRVPPEEVTRQAVQFMRALAKEFPDCQFHFIFGNHDCAQELHDEFVKLASGLDNFFVHRTHLILGDALFTHGDILLGGHPKDKNKIQPPRNLDDASRVLIPQKDIYDDSTEGLIIAAAGSVGHTVQNLWTAALSSGSYLLGALFMRRDLERQAADAQAEAAGIRGKKSYKAYLSEFYLSLQKAIQRWLDEMRDPLTDARTIVTALADAHPDMVKNINHVFTGHTHVPYVDIELKDIRDKKNKPICEKLIMHNTGAPLIGAKLNLMTMALEDGKMTKIKEGKDYKHRIPYYHGKPREARELKKYAEEIKHEAVDKWHKRIEKKSDVEFDAPEWTI